MQNVVALGEEKKPVRMPEKGCVFWCQIKDRMQDQDSVGYSSNDNNDSKKHCLAVNGYKAQHEIICQTIRVRKSLADSADEDVAYSEESYSTVEIKCVRFMNKL